MHAHIDLRSIEPNMFGLPNCRSNSNSRGRRNSRGSKFGRAFTYAHRIFSSGPSELSISDGSLVGWAEQFAEGFEARGLPGAGSIIAPRGRGSNDGAGAATRSL